MSEKATVYYLPLKKGETNTSLAKKTSYLFEQAGFGALIHPDKLVAIKQHFGEKGNKGYLKPKIARKIVDAVRAKDGKPLLVETNTLYHGSRSNSYDHLMLAYEHGFTMENVGAPILILDGVNGQNQQTVPVSGKHFQSVYVVPDLRFFDAMFVLSHVKGHMAAGMGGAIKNLAMGFASRAGKLIQHSDFVPQVDESRCTLCGSCTEMCPAEALSLADEALNVDYDKCIGCGECFTACPNEAFSFNWGEIDDKFQEKMAEYALGAVINHPHKVAYLNYFFHVSQHCDCLGGDNPPLADNVGLFASRDPVAVDKACYDVGIEVLGRDIFKEFWPELDATTQMRHGARIGLGSLEYHLERISL